MLPRVFLLFFFSDEVIDNLFSNIRGGIERACERQEVLPSSTESEQSVSLDDEELWKFLEEQKNCNTQKKTLSDLRTWYHWCEEINEKRKIENFIPPKELDRLLGHFYCTVWSAS